MTFAVEIRKTDLPLSSRWNSLFTTHHSSVPRHGEDAMAPGVDAGLTTRTLATASR